MDIEEIIVNLKLLEQPKKSISENNQKRDIIDDLGLKYKPIENYRAFSNFLPRKKT